MPERGSIACCGFNELVFTGCQSGYPSDLDDFKTWLIQYDILRETSRMFERVWV